MKRQPDCLRLSRQRLNYVVTKELSMKDQLVASRLTIFALLVFGALPIYAQNPDLVSHAQPSCGTATAQFHVTASNTLTEPQVDLGKALIYLVEEQKLHYHDVTVRVGRGAPSARKPGRRGSSSTGSRASPAESGEGVG